MNKDIFADTKIFKGIEILNNQLNLWLEIYILAEVKKNKTYKRIIKNR